MRRLIASVLVLCSLGRAHALDLVEAYESALRHDATFAAEASAYDAGLEYAAQGRAALRPRLNLTSRASRLETDVTTGLTGATSSLLAPNASGDVYGYSVSLSQPLYRPSALADARSFGARAQIAELTFAAVRQDLILRVAQAYTTVLLAQESLALARAQKAAVAEQLASAKARFESGRARVTDVAEAQARFDALLASEIATASELEIARARFASLTGRDDDEPQPLPAASLAAPREDLQAWIARGRADGYESRVRELELAIAETDVARTRLSGRIAVDLVARYEDQRQDGELSPLAYPDVSRGSSVGIELSVPLYAGGALSSQHRQAVARRNQARQQLEATRRETDVEIRDAYSDVVAGAQRVSALEQGLVSAQTSLDAGVLGLEVGSRTNLDVLSLRQDVYDVRRDLAEARYTLLLARLRLLALAGGLDDTALRTVAAAFSA